MAREQARLNAVMHLSLATLSPWLPLKAIRNSLPRVLGDAALLQHFADSFQRGVVRGSVGKCLGAAGDVCHEWGFDPRLIETRNVVIWHSADDTLCPPKSAAGWPGCSAQRRGSGSTSATTMSATVT